jgi:hypothetical protein
MTMVPRSLVPFVFFGACFLVPSLATAQSAITGLVRDTTGAVLPGVTVEAASPVLIEKVRTGVSDAQGRYSIVDLRPGTYTVTITLPGFNTFKSEGLELPSNFTATVNADLRVGSLEETITVTGLTPVVDVQTTGRTQVISRDLLDSVPTARNATGLASLMPGVRMTATDVGGSQQMEQIYMTTQGSRRTDTTVQVDGMMMNALLNNGEVQAYFSDAAAAEVSLSTTGSGADVSGGGVRINMIPKEGGNKFSGSAFIGGTNGKWQSSNVTPQLRALGLVSGDKVDQISDYNVSLGGPLKRDKLWFFATWRRISTNEIVPDNFYADGSPGIEDQWIQNQMVRLTWQVSQKNKLTVFHDRYPKFKGHEMGARTDPETASQRRDPEHALYYTGQVKWTSTLSSRLMFEGGYSTNIEMLLISNQPGIKKERGTPEWFSNVRHNDILLGTFWEVGSLENGIYPHRHVFSGIASYVTGSHNIKTGVQWSFGKYRTSYDANGDLYQLYQNGVPSFVTVLNTPVYGIERMNADMGTFVQDSWTLRRLTMNAGVRFEYFNASIEEQGVPAGRFAPLRSIARSPNMPNWLDVTPRLGVSYDVFGNAKTALKASFNKYMAGQTTAYPQRYNPLAIQSERRTWTDRDLGGLLLPTNGDDIAQDNEIGPPVNALFGQAIGSIRPADDLGREYDLVYSVGVQHEIRPGLGASINWFRRGAYNLRRTDNDLVSLNDYSPIDIINPLDGTPITIYNLNPAKLGAVDRVDRSATDSSLRRRNYDGVEFGFNTRFRSLSAFGAYTFDRDISVNCDGSNATGTSATDPNTFRFCDQSKLDIPLRHEFKLAGSYRLPWWDIQVNSALQSYTGSQTRVDWTLSRTARYPADCAAPCQPNALVVPTLTVPSLTVQLTAPGTRFYPRHTQLDLGVRKLFRVKNMQWSAQADIFNINNSSRVSDETQLLGPSLGRPLAILQPRLLRLAAQLRF